MKTLNFNLRALKNNKINNKEDQLEIQEDKIINLMMRLKKMKKLPKSKKLKPSGVNWRLSLDILNG